MNSFFTINPSTSLVEFGFPIAQLKTSPVLEVLGVISHQRTK